MEHISEEKVFQTPVSPQDSVEYMKVMLRLARLRTLLCGIVAAVMIGLCAFALQMGAQVGRILSHAESTFMQLDAISADIDAANVPGMIEEINVLVQDGQTAAAAATRSMQEAAAKMEALDIDTLNSSIADFAAVVAPLSKLFGK